MLSRRNFLASLAATPLIFGVTTPALAGEPEVYAINGNAINGYDPIAYFTQDGPVEGAADHTSVYKGATWQFSSADNKALFDGDPVKYAPQYGGYCAYAVSKGYTATTAPNAWAVEDGKLYLNYSRAVRVLWRRDIPGHIKSANANWPKVLG
jgi:YHS domain-containing protein